MVDRLNRRSVPPDFDNPHLPVRANRHERAGATIQLRRRRGTRGGENTKRNQQSYDAIEDHKGLIDEVARRERGQTVTNRLTHIIAAITFLGDLNNNRLRTHKTVRN